MPQDLTFTSDFSEHNWGLARSIRRDPPWNPIRPSFPIRTSFDCVRDGTGVDIYCLDSGVDTTHSELLGRVTNVYNPTTPGAQNGDDHGHGTAAASVAAGLTCGIARGAQLRTFKMYTSTGFTDSITIVNACNAAIIDYNNRAALGRPGILMANFCINGGAIIDSPISEAIGYGMIVIASAHNYAVDSSGWTPTRVADVITAGGISACDLPYYLGVSVDAFDAVQIGTNFGSGIDILAPAQGMKMARASVLGGGFRVYSGNSFSCPTVAGIAACMMQGQPRLTSRAQVQTFNAKLLANATTGRFRSGFGLAPLPDRIAYLDPTIATEAIF